MRQSDAAPRVREGVTRAAHHDSLFRRLFADRSIAAEAVASVLPPDVRALIDLSALELLSSAYVDQALHPLYSDVVFAARIAGRDARLLLLLEHQSRPDRLMPFRLLQYAVMLWDAYLRDHPSAGRLPVIVPVVFHQGPGTWSTSRDLIDLVDLTPSEAAVLGRYVPRMGFELDDLGTTGDAGLLARGMRAEATLALSALRDVRGASDVPALVARWGDLLRDARETASGTRALATVLRYILEVHSGLDVEELSRLADGVLAGTGAEVMTTARQFMEIGKAEGKAEGRRATLRNLVRLKFRDAATPDVLARLDAADDEMLARVEERLLTAASVTELFG